jgi:hypothetical protein
VETLLLQWALLDRTVEIADLLAALKGRGSDAGPSRRPRPEAPPPRSANRPGGRRVPAQQVQPAGGVKAPPPPDQPAAPIPEGGPTIEWLASQWQAFLDGVGKRNPMVRELLSRARPVRVGGGEVGLEVEGDMPLEGLERNKTVVAEALSRVVGGPTRAVFTTPEAAVDTPPPEAKRQTVEGDREARMRAYRAQDPTLDAVAEALDLELLE